MADLYGTRACSTSTSLPSLPPTESEDMSTFLHHLLHNNPSSASSTSCMSTKTRHLQSLTPFQLLMLAPVPAGLFQAKASPENMRGKDRFDANFESDCRVRVGNLAVVDSSSSFNCSDPGGCFSSDLRDSRENGFSCVGAVETEVITSSAMRKNFQAENDSDGYDSEKGPEASEVPANPMPPRTSSKRNRAAEIHNLSEKRRRNRINEKMKVLQKLIPNSNKTDKASMLDEAIEYIKQLQLQIQMLSMRNGLSLQPLYLPGGLQPMQLLQSGTSFDDRNGLLNTNAGASHIAADQEPSIQTAFDLSSHCTPSNQPITVPNSTNMTNSETPFGFEPVIEAQYRPLNLSTPSKDLGRADTLPELQLDMSRSGKNNSSSGVS